MTIEDDDGATWVFESGGKSFLGFTPSHLREHMVQGQTVEVRFRQENGKLLVDEIMD